MTIASRPLEEPGHARRMRNHQNLRGQAAGIVDRLLQPCCMTDARTAPEKGLALQLKARLPGISPMIWQQVAMGWEAIHLFQFSVRGVTPADTIVQIGSTPHAQDQVSVLVSRALQRGALKSGNGTNSCLTPEILVVPMSDLSTMNLRQLLGLHAGIMEEFRRRTSPSSCFAAPMIDKGHRIRRRGSRRGTAMQIRPAYEQLQVHADRRRLKAPDIGDKRREIALPEARNMPVDS